MSVHEDCTAVTEIGNIKRLVAFWITDATIRSGQTILPFHARQIVI